MAANDTHCYAGRDSSVGIATRYGLNGPGIESRWVEILLTRSDLGRGVDHPTPSSAEVKERVDLYLCSPSGPSWPVVECTLLLHLLIVALLD